MPLLFGIITDTRKNMRFSYLKAVWFFLILFALPVANSKEIIKNAIWCFTIPESAIDFSTDHLIDFQVTYLDAKSKKWKTVQKSKCGWNYQPDFSLQKCYQFVAPASLTAFEITFFFKQKSSKLLIDNIPDSIASYKLIGFRNFSLLEKNNQYKFSQLKEVFVSQTQNIGVYPLKSLSQEPTIETNQLSYLSQSPINIYIEAPDANQMLVLYGCGTPGTLYRIQQWLNGVWIEYQNNWNVKCPHEKFVVNRYIVGLTIQREGIFRVLFDLPSTNTTQIPSLVSNPFQVYSK